MASNLKVIGFVAVLVALVAVFGGQLTSLPATGYAVSSQECQGAPTLTLTPNPARLGDVVTSKISGLVGCEGRMVELRKDNCFGPLLDTIKCVDSDCSAVGYIKYSATGAFQIAACLDKNRNGYLYDPGERGAAVLDVKSLPDLAITELDVPVRVASRTPFQPIATVENLGTETISFANIFFDLYKTTATADKYYGTTQMRESLVLTWPESAADSATVAGQFYVTLPPGGKQDVLMRSIDLTPGEYRLVVRADWKSIYRTDNTAVDEFSKSNNQLETTFTVV